eukprot:m.259870 g.259870  ORF g.259870 m.259870 type:complete len:78 (+) comp15556_c2_seq22:1335-1568(+)
MASCKAQTQLQTTQLQSIMDTVVHLNQDRRNISDKTEKEKQVLNVETWISTAQGIENWYVMVEQLLTRGNAPERSVA